MKTILFTGGSSFIGKTIIKLLLSLNYKVLSLERSTNFEFKNFSNFEFFKFDLSNDDIDKLPSFKDVDFICHLAAYKPSNFNLIAESKLCYDVNANGTLKLLEIAKNNGINNFIYYSAGNAYELNNINQLKLESDCLYPSRRASIYLTSKFAGEIFVDNYSRTYGIKSTIFRISSIYGNNNVNDITYNFINKLINNQPIEINNSSFGSDFIYYMDIVKATIYTIQNSLYGIYNLGSGKRSTLVDIFHEIRKYFPNSHSKVIIEKSINGDLGFCALNVEKLYNFLKPSKPTPLEIGIKDIYENLKPKSNGI